MSEGYPHTPGFEAESDTSEAAAESMEGEASSLRALVLQFIRESREYGSTCDEAEERLSLRHQTASARIRELVLRNRVTDSGRRRPTRSGRMAVVYVAIVALATPTDLWEWAKTKHPGPS